MGKKKDRIGETFVSNEGYSFVIVEYNRYDDLIVEFQDEYKARVLAYYCNCRSGQIKNPYHPSVFGIGCLGLMSDGSKPITCLDSEHTREYNLWHSLIQRCYDPKMQEKHPTYKGITVCDRWLVFANFLEDIESIEGYDKWVNDNTYDLDKDLLQQDVPNNEKVYSPDTCCFISSRENRQEMMKRRWH